MKKWISLLIILFLIPNLFGCEAIRKKFTRKKKEAVKAPRIYQLKKYEKTPAPELYKKHYAYWASWQSELIKVLGSNHRKDMRCIEEITGNLKDMQNILVQEKADQMAPHIYKMIKVRDILSTEELSQFNKDYVRRSLEKTERAIKRDFSYIKVKNYLKTDFDDEPRPRD